MAVVSMLVTYHPKPGSENALLELVKKHWGVLHGLGLATATPAKTWRGRDKRTGAEFFVEMFEWVDERASDVAHELPEVMAVWETMGPLLAGMNLTRLEPLV